MPPILCDSSEANVTVGDFSPKAADIAIDPNAGRVPILAGRAGISYAELLGRIVEAAARRCGLWT